MANWQTVPKSVWAFVGVLLVNLIVIELTISAPVGALLALPFVVLALSYYFLLGLRWLWIVTLILYVANIPGILLNSTGWVGSLFILVGLALLLLPDTRRHFKKAAS